MISEKFCPFSGRLHSTDTGKLDSVEIWNIESSGFVLGPPLPDAQFGISLLNIREEVYYLGGGWNSGVYRMKNDFSGWEKLETELSTSFAFGKYVPYNYD